MISFIFGFLASCLFSHFLTLPSTIISSPSTYSAILGHLCHSFVSLVSYRTLFLIPLYAKFFSGWYPKLFWLFSSDHSFLEAVFQVLFCIDFASFWWEQTGPSIFMQVLALLPSNGKSRIFLLFPTFPVQYFIILIFFVLWD